MRICVRHFTQTTSLCRWILFPSNQPLLPRRQWRTFRILAHPVDAGVGKRNCLTRGLSDCATAQIDQKEADHPGGPALLDEVRSNSSYTHDHQDEERRMRPAEADRQCPEAWANILNQFLSNEMNQSSPVHKLDFDEQDKLCSGLLTVLRKASFKINAGTDMLAYLGLKQNRWETVLELVSLLLSNVSRLSSVQKPLETAPSNLNWQGPRLLKDLCSNAITAHFPRDMENVHSMQGLSKVDYPDSECARNNPDHTMAQIWKTLGYIIIDAAELSEEKAESAMRFVFRVIAQIHNIGLVPENVYSYNPTSYTSSVHRSPIIHLLSSRILATLSDAVWRARQDEIIAEEVKRRGGYHGLIDDLPGGRFLLKVRPLGPELWLEFVLWCCVEGGYAVTGSKIIEHLRELIDRPWFAVPWTSSPGSTSHVPRINWAQIKLRHGGTVGLAEGYSREEPFAVMEPRTISAEVVLALIDSLPNVVNTGVFKRGSGLDKVQSSIKSLIGFLDPKVLPAGYFDHLAVRLLQTGSFDPDRSPGHIQLWAETLLEARALDTIQPATNTAPCLDLEPILSHSELIYGVFHQSFDAYVAFGDLRRALGVFAQIQQLVDSSKLQSISSFLNPPLDPSEGIFPSRTARNHENFVLSHGQIPIYKLAAFLDLISESKLTRLGDWLLYSEDVDGPMIPTSFYKIPSLAPALIRFARASGNEELLFRVADASRRTNLSTSVSLLRALAHSHMKKGQFGVASRLLMQMKRSKAGSKSASDLVALATAILSLEHHAQGAPHKMALEQAYSTFEGLLSGVFQSNVAVYYTDQLRIQRRQISALLRILEQVQNSELAKFATDFRGRYPETNEASLLTDDFNLLLRTVAETKGSGVARSLWDMFCKDPREKYSLASAFELGHYIIPKSTETETGDWEFGHYLRESKDRPPLVEGFLPLIEADFTIADATALSNQKDGGLQTYSAKVQRRSKIDDHDGWLHPGSDEQMRSSISLNFDQGNPTPFSDLHMQSKSAAANPSASLPMSPYPRRDLSPPPEAEGHVSRLSSCKQPIAPIPLVTPNLRTLRLIVRSALSELRLLSSHSLPTDAPQSVIEWSKPLLRAFGIRGSALEAEIQQRLTPVDVVNERLNPDEERRANARATRGQVLTRMGQSRGPGVAEIKIRRVPGALVTRTRASVGGSNGERGRGRREEPAAEG